MRREAGYWSVPRADGGLGAWLDAGAVVVAVAVAVLFYGLLGGGPASAQSSDNSSGICGRTEAVREAILSRLSNVSDCADVTDSQLSRIEGTITVAGNASNTLQDGDFAGLSRLEILYVHNNLTSIEVDALDGLSALRELHLNSNSLTSLPSDVFDDLTILEKLQLESNGLTSLPEDIFENTRLLNHLNLMSNGLTALPDGLFDGLSGLRALHLGSNPGSPFTFTAELERAEGGVLVKVSEGAPFDMGVVLLADGATLSSSRVTVEGGSTTSTAVTVTPSGDSAVTVSVSSADFPIDNFHQYGGIQAATGASVTFGEFCGRTLAVQTAVLAELDDVSSCMNVTDSHLSGMDPDVVDTSGGNFVVSGVTTLQSGDFDGLSSLRSLDISYVSRDAETDMRSLPEDIFEDLESLEILNLNANDLTSLPADIFDGLTELTRLNLISNDLISLPEDIFDGLTSLDTLNLGYNELSSLPADVFDGLTSLRALWLYFNELSSLPADVFDGLSSLTLLHVDGNELSSLPADVFDGTPNLGRLHVDGNELSSLPSGVFDGLTELDSLELQDNPGSPFTLTAALESTDDGVVVKVAEGAPFDIAVTLSAEGATLSSTTVTVEAGSTTSSAVTVTPTGTSDATVSVDSATFEGGTDRQGIQTGTGSSLAIAVNSPATGAPTISGTAQVGHTLTADTSGIQDTDGLTDVTYSYQWLSGDTPIDGATGSSYVLQATDATNTIKVKVSFTDDEGNDETLTSEATAEVGAGGL